MGKGAGQRAWGAVVDYFRALWSGTEPLHRILVSDLLIGGTLINVATLAVALFLFGLEAPKWLAVAVFFSPLPYNLFLVVSVWRTAGGSGSVLAWTARIVSLAWIGCMLLI